MTEGSAPPLRIHPPLVRAVNQTLADILENGIPADKALLRVRRNRQLGSRDRRFIHSHVYDIVRYLRWLQHIAEETQVRPQDLFTAFLVMNVIRTGSTVDPSAFPGFTTDQINAWTKALAHPAADPGPVTDSIPDWMWEQGKQDYGDAWPDIARSLNDTPTTYIRANTLKTDPAELMQLLQRRGIDAAFVEGTDALVLPEPRPMENEPAYREGLFEFQDLASQQVAVMSAVEPGMTVLDICAGAGGKTLHLAALMENRGLIMTADKLPERMDQLTYRAKRNGVRCSESVDFRDLEKWNGRADRVVIDAPCTASGTIWRKPDIKWRVQPEDLVRYSRIQADLLRTGLPLLKPGGLLIFATCSIFKAEGEELVRAFLDAEHGVKLLNERRFLPGTDRTDGFYIAVIEREPED